MLQVTDIIYEVDFLLCDGKASSVVGTFLPLMATILPCPVLASICSPLADTVLDQSPCSLLIKALPHLQGSAFITALRQINTVINVATFVDGVICLQTPHAAVEITPSAT